MATEDGENVQQAEKVILKRKLTGPPRLLLGKNRTRSVEEDRPEARTNSDKTENTGRDESSLKYSAAAETGAAELTETASMNKEGSSDINVESSRGRCGAAGEDDDIRNRKVNRHRWWRRFSPAVVCNRKQKKDVEESLEKQKNESSVPPQGVLHETDAALLMNINTEENTEKVTEGKKRFNLRTWPMFKRFLTSSNVRQAHKQRRDFVEKDGDEPSLTFRKKLQNYFTKGGKKRSSGVPLENMDDMINEALCSSVAQVDEPTKLHSNVTVGSPEVVTVTTEVSIQLTENRAAAESPDKTPTEEQLVCGTGITEEDLTDAVDGPEIIQTDSEVVEGHTDTNNVPVKDLVEVVSSEKDKVFCVSTKVILDADDQLSASTTSSQDASEPHCETTSQTLQPSANRPSIRIELVPPDNVTQEDDEEEEECWEGSSSSVNQNRLLLLLGVDHSERQLVQTARFLVRAAMNAAVDQLTREQQSESGCVHREPQGCRDHA